MPHKVKSPIRYAGKRREIGEVLELDKLTATQLVAMGCVEEVKLPVVAPVALNDQQSGVVTPQYQEGRLAGVVLPDGSFVALADMPEAELRQLATKLEIADAGTLALADLVAALGAEPVQVPAGGSDAGAGAGAGDQAQADQSAAAAPVPAKKARNK